MRSFRIGQPVLPGQNIIMAPQFQLGPPGGGGFASQYGGAGPIGAYNQPVQAPQQALPMPTSIPPVGGTTILPPSAPVYEAEHPIQEAVSYLTPEAEEFGGYAWPTQQEPPSQQWLMTQPIITIQQPQPQFAPAAPTGGPGPVSEAVPTPPQLQTVDEEEFPWWILLVALGAGALIYEIA